MVFGFLGGAEGFWGGGEIGWVRVVEGELVEGKLVGLGEIYEVSYVKNFYFGRGTIGLIVLFWSWDYWSYSAD